MHGGLLIQSETHWGQVVRSPGPSAPAIAAPTTTTSARTRWWWTSTGDPDEPAARPDLRGAARSSSSDNRGFDFTGYKRSSLERRIGKRMEAVGVPAYADYLDYLEVHPDEFAQLFNTILINVTAFFRDAPAWELPARRGRSRSCSAEGRDGEPIRVWSAGLRDGRGGVHARDGARRGARRRARYRERVKIYATDVDEEALADGAPGDLHGQGGRGRPARRCASATSSAPTAGTCSARTCAAR